MFTPITVKTTIGRTNNIILFVLEVPNSDIDKVLSFFINPIAISAPMRTPIPSKITISKIEAEGANADVLRFKPKTSNRNIFEIMIAIR